eukprot:1176942-Prorocentrum_minimum.AAC.3
MITRFQSTVAAGGTVDTVWIPPRSVIQSAGSPTGGDVGSLGGSGIFAPCSGSGARGIGSGVAIGCSRVGMSDGHGGGGWGAVAGIF